MNDYNKILEFFMENNIKLTTTQLEALKEEFLDETSITKKADNVGNIHIKNAPKDKEYLIMNSVDEKGRQKVVEKDTKTGKLTDMYMNPKDAKFISNKAKLEK